MDDSLKRIGRDLWANKPLLIALLIAAGVGIFILIKNSQTQATGSVSSMPAGASMASGGATYVEGGSHVAVPTQQVATITTLTGATATATPVLPTQTTTTNTPLLPPLKTGLAPHPASNPTQAATSTSSAKYVTVKAWPDQLGSLWGIAQANNISLAQIEKLNPGIKNPSLIYTGQKVRVA